MKRTTAIIVLALMILAILGGCKTSTTTPSASPNVPVVSESPAIPSPTTGESPAASAKVSPSPSASPETSPAASK
ncbi:MAG: hypothetical protein VB064_02490 [Oscillospiraceae bacterium]|nr:hypothetical protein [Oscillospiraceae bacterium]